MHHHLSVVPTLSQGTQTAHKALKKAKTFSGPKKPGESNLVFWWTMVARFNLAVALGITKSLAAGLHGNESSVEDWNRQTNHFLEMCTSTAEMWGYTASISTKNNSHKALVRMLGDVTEILVAMSSFGGNMEEVVAEEIKTAIKHLKDCKTTAHK